MRNLTVPQLDPDACTDPRPAPELSLLAAVIHRAVLDLHKPQYRVEAQAFIDSEELDRFCDWLGWGEGWVRQAIAEGIAPGSSWYR